MKFVPLSFIVLYQVIVSPIFRQMFVTSSCRFSPTCSDYMKEAIGQFGVLAGVWLGLKRISRCHPKGSFGIDPIPAK